MALPPGEEDIDYNDFRLEMETIWIRVAHFHICSGEYS
jgi:hypothetical protein